MRRILPTAVVLLSLAIIVGGCAQTPMAKVVQARELYSSTLNVLADARAAGKISDKDALAIEEARKVAQDALDQMEVDALAGKAPSLSTASTVFNDALEALLRWRVRVQKGQ
jgi:hypothetical protein